MQKVNVSLNPENYRLLSNYSLYGFKNSDEAINSALDLLSRNLDKSLSEMLEASATLYLDEYKKNNEIANLTESALNDYTE